MNEISLSSSLLDIEEFNSDKEIEIFISFLNGSYEYGYKDKMFYSIFNSFLGIKPPPTFKDTKHEKAFSLLYPYLEKQVAFGTGKGGYKEWGEDYNRALGLYGKHKTKQLAQFPETARAVVIEKGIPTENGIKNISEATVREIESYKKQLKQKDERISALESAEPRVIEKRVEVPPSDYYSLQRANESLQREVENNVTKLSGVKSLLDLEQQKYKLLESESREAKELKSNIDTLLDTKESLSNQIKLLTEFLEEKND